MELDTTHDTTDTFNTLKLFVKKLNSTIIVSFIVFLVLRFTQRKYRHRFCWVRLVYVTLGLGYITLSLRISHYNVIQF